VVLAWWANAENECANFFMRPSNTKGAGTVEHARLCILTSEANFCNKIHSNVFSSSFRTSVEMESPGASTSFK